MQLKRFILPRRFKDGLEGTDLSDSGNWVGVAVGIALILCGLSAGILKTPPIAREWQHFIGWFGIVFAGGCAPRYMTSWLRHRFAGAVYFSLACAFLCLAVRGNLIARMSGLAGFMLGLVVVAIFLAARVCADFRPKRTPIGSEWLFAALFFSIAAIALWEGLLQPLSRFTRAYASRPGHIQWEQVLVGYAAVGLAVAALYFVIPLRTRHAFTIWKGPAKRFAVTILFGLSIGSMLTAFAAPACERISCIVVSFFLLVAAVALRAS